MNKEEVKFDHFKDIEELIKHLEMWYAEDDYFAFDRYFHLRDARIMGMFIYELQQENKQLKEEINKISKKEIKVRNMLYSIENGTLTRERLMQIEEVLFELEGNNEN